MDDEIAVKLIDIIPSLLWTAIIFYVLFRYRQQIEDALRRLGSVKIFGIEAEFSQQREQDLKQATISYELTPDVVELEAVVKRANRLHDKLRGSRILWVDDNLLANANVFRFLNSYGVEIDKVATTEESLPALKWGSNAYDAIVTDMKRGNDNEAGKKLIAIAQDLHVQKPIIILVVELDHRLGIPAGAMAITDSPVQLIHHFMSVVDGSYIPPKPHDEAPSNP